MRKRNQSLVTVSVGDPQYPAQPPFHPPAEVAECLFPEHSIESNAAYVGVRECLRLAELDIRNFGTLSGIRWAN